MPVLARNIVATSQPLAAQAGVSMLLQGGNAVDAALAAAITLTVVEPTSNGIGSDAFALVWDGRDLHGLNASGRSPAAWTRRHFDKYRAMPLRGWDSVTVPGAVSAWSALSRRFGSLPFPSLFQPAIGYARSGFPVSPITSRAWQQAARLFKEFPEFCGTFLPGGRAPFPGEVFRCEDQARTLEAIAETEGADFYAGELARRIAQRAGTTGGLLTMDDLAAHSVEWVNPLSLPYQGVEVLELPPNGQGIAALMMLGIVAHLDICRYPPDSAESLHLQIEAMKLAFADVYRHVGDPGHMCFNAERMLGEGYLASRARLVDPARAQDYAHGLPGQGDTVYLTAADARGMMVSYIQSNYMGFGSGIVIPGTGISLQNRGSCFSLERGHPNEVAGSKRPFHTIIPAFLMKNGEPLMSFGVMGGPMQPQGHAQLLVRILTYGQNPQAASDAPRWQVMRDRTVLMEEGTDRAVLSDLAARGHDVGTAESGSFGGAQLICRMADGYCGASDHRKDGQAVGY